MFRERTNQLKLVPIKILGIICLSSVISVQAQQFDEGRRSSIDTKYLESKNALKDYILDTGDVLRIRFKNRPGKSQEKELEEKQTNDISYLEPRNNIKNYILDSGDSIYINFNLDIPNNDLLNSDPYSNIYTIDQEGEVYLPEIKSTFIKGLTISELKFLLDKRYDEYLVYPNIEIRINNFKFIPNGEFQINEEGEITLPEIPTDPDEITRKTFVRGLTTNGLKKLLKQRYSKYLINPDIFIDIIKYKPIRLVVNGEVRKPGLVNLPGYTSSSYSNILGDEEQNKDNDLISNSDELNNLSNALSTNEYNNNRSNLSNNNQIKSETQFLTTLSNAIRAAGGLTSYSDISNIEIFRDTPIEQGGGKKRAVINFLSYITKSDNTYDIRLFDGDIISIPSLKERDPSIIPNSILSGLSPKFIEVSIKGQIENPGIVKLPIEGSLSDLMNLQGPRKPLAGKIFLIRYNQDGTLLRKNISYSSRAIPGSLRNPMLVSGDLITVKNSILGRASGTLKAITDPFVGIYATKEVVETLRGKEF